MINKFIIIVTFIMLCTFQAYAEDSLLVPLDMPSKPVSAQGLIISKAGLNPVKISEIIKKSQGGYGLVISMSELSALEAGSFATAIATDSEGTRYYGSMVAIDNADFYNRSAQLPYCEQTEVTPFKLAGQYALLESLVAVRSARRDYNQKMIKEELNPEFLDQLKKLEAGFGLKAKDELSASMHPVILIQRLSRILNTVKSYNSNK